MPSSADFISELCHSDRHLGPRWTLIKAKCLNRVVDTVISELGNYCILYIIQFASSFALRLVGGVNWNIMRSRKYKNRCLKTSAD